jgi:hypothetical protein
MLVSVEDLPIPPTIFRTLHNSVNVPEKDSQKYQQEPSYLRLQDSCF